MGDFSQKNIFTTFGSLRVSIVEAIEMMGHLLVKGRKKVDLWKNVYCSVYVIDEKGESSVKCDSSVVLCSTSEPLRVGEEFIFDGVSSLSQLVVIFYALEFKNQAECIGITMIPISRLEENKTVLQWYQLFKSEEEGILLEGLRSAVKIECSFVNEGLSFKNNVKRKNSIDLHGILPKEDGILLNKRHSFFTDNDTSFSTSAEVLMRKNENQMGLKAMRLKSIDNGDIREIGLDTCNSLHWKSGTTLTHADRVFDASFFSQNSANSSLASFEELKKYREVSLKFDEKDGGINRPKRDEKNNHKFKAGLVDYALIFGPIEPNLLFPTHKLNPRTGRIDMLPHTNLEFCTKPTSPSGTATTVGTPNSHEGAAENKSETDTGGLFNGNQRAKKSPPWHQAQQVEIGVWDRLPRQDLPDLELPNKLEWFACPEGSITLLSLKRPDPYFQSFVLSTGGETVEVYGLSLNFFINLGKWREICKTDQNCAEDFDCEHCKEMKRKRKWYQNFQKGRKVRENSDLDINPELTKNAGVRKENQNILKRRTSEKFKSNQSSSASLSQNSSTSECQCRMWTSVTFSLVFRTPYIQQLKHCLTHCYREAILPNLRKWEETAFFKGNSNLDIQLQKTRDGEFSFSHDLGQKQSKASMRNNSAIFSTANESLLSYLTTSFILPVESLLALICLESPLPIPGFLAVSLILPPSSKPPKSPLKTHNSTQQSRRLHTLRKKLHSYDRDILDHRHSSFDHSDVVTFAAPHPESLPVCQYTLDSLLEFFGPRVLIDVVCCVLSECRLLFHSTDMSRLPIICEALRVLIYPLRWTHVYLPVVPAQLMNIFEAPVPFMLGTNSKWLKYIQLDYLDDIVIVDCDSGAVDLGSASVMKLPSKEDRWLMLALTTLETSSHWTDDRVSNKSKTQDINKTLCSKAVKDDNIPLFRSEGEKSSKNSKNPGRKGKEKSDLLHTGEREDEEILDISIGLQLIFFDLMLSFLRYVPDCLFYLNPSCPVFNRSLFINDFTTDELRPFLETLTITNAFHELTENIHTPSLRFFFDSIQQLNEAEKKSLDPAFTRDEADRGAGINPICGSLSNTFSFRDTGVGGGKGKEGNKSSIALKSKQSKENLESISPSLVSKKSSFWMNNMGKSMNRNVSVSSVIYDKILSSTPTVRNSHSKSFFPDSPSSGEEPSLLTRSNSLRLTHATPGPKSLSPTPSSISFRRAEKPKLQRSFSNENNTLDEKLNLSLHVNTEDTWGSEGKITNLYGQYEGLLPSWLFKNNGNSILSIRDILVQRCTKYLSNLRAPLSKDNPKNKGSGELKKSGCSNSSLEENEKFDSDLILKLDVTYSSVLNEERSPFVPCKSAGSRWDLFSVSSKSDSTSGFSNFYLGGSMESMGKSKSRLSIINPTIPKKSTFSQNTSSLPVVTRFPSFAGPSKAVLELEKSGSEEVYENDEIDKNLGNLIDHMVLSRQPSAISHFKEHKSSDSDLDGNEHKEVQDPINEDLEMIPALYLVHFSHEDVIQAQRRVKRWRLLDVAEEVGVSDEEIVKFFQRIRSKLTRESQGHWLNGKQNQLKRSSNLFTPTAQKKKDKKHFKEPQCDESITVFLQKVLTDIELDKDWEQKDLKSCLLALQQKHNRDGIVNILKNAKKSKDSTDVGANVYPLNATTFDALSQLFSGLLTICSQQEDFLCAYGLLEVGGLYFQVQNLDLNLDQSLYEEEDVVEFLSERTCQHPIYQNPFLWLGILLNQLPTGEKNILPTNSLRSRSMSTGEFKRKENHPSVKTVISEANALLYTMLGMGVNSSRAVLFIQSVASEYGLGINDYFKLHRFISRLWPQQTQDQLQNPLNNPLNNPLQDPDTTVADSQPDSPIGGPGARKRVRGESVGGSREVRRASMSVTDVLNMQGFGRKLDKKESSDSFYSIPSREDVLLELHQESNNSNSSGSPNPMRVNEVFSEDSSLSPTRDTLTSESPNSPVKSSQSGGLPGMKDRRKGLTIEVPGDLEDEGQLQQEMGNNNGYEGNNDTEEGEGGILLFSAPTPLSKGEPKNKCKSNSVASDEDKHLSHSRMTSRLNPDPTLAAGEEDFQPNVSSHSIVAPLPSETQLSPFKSALKPSSTGDKESKKVTKQLSFKLPDDRALEQLLGYNNTSNNTSSAPSPDTPSYGSKRSSLGLSTGPASEEGSQKFTPIEVQGVEEGKATAIDVFGSWLLVGSTVGGVHVCDLADGGAQYFRLKHSSGSGPRYHGVTKVHGLPTTEKSLIQKPSVQDSSETKKLGDSRQKIFFSGCSHGIVKAWSFADRGSGRLSGAPQRGGSGQSWGMRMQLRMKQAFAVIKSHSAPITELASAPCDGCENDDWMLASGCARGELTISKGNLTHATSSTVDLHSYFVQSSETQAPSMAGGGSVTSLVFFGSGANGSNNETNYSRGGFSNCCLLAVGTSKGLVSVVDVGVVTPVYQVEGHNGRISQLLSLRSNEFLSCGWDRSIKLWDIRTRNRATAVLASVSGPVGATAAGAGGTVFMGRSPMSTVGRNMPQQLEERELGGTDSVRRCGASPITAIAVGGWDNSLVISSSADGLIRLWDLRYDVNVPCSVIKGHTNRITSIAWEGKDEFHTSSYDGTVRSWDSINGRATNSIKVFNDDEGLLNMKMSKFNCIAAVEVGNNGVQARDKREIGANSGVLVKRECLVVKGWNGSIKGFIHDVVRK